MFDKRGVTHFTMGVNMLCVQYGSIDCEGEQLRDSLINANKVCFWFFILAVLPLGQQRVCDCM